MFAVSNNRIVLKRPKDQKDSPRENNLRRESPSLLPKQATLEKRERRGKKSRVQVGWTDWGSGGKSTSCWWVPVRGRPPPLPPTPLSFPTAHLLIRAEDGPRIWQKTKIGFGQSRRTIKLLEYSIPTLTHHTALQILGFRIWPYLTRNSSKIK